MNNEETPKVHMVLPCICPHCGDSIVIKLDIPTPEVTAVLRPEEVDDEIKKLIENNNDITQEPKAA